MALGNLAITSPDFGEHERIPDPLSADGGHGVPRLRFAGVPAGTVELAVICHDPDAPMPDGFTHWSVYGIPATATELDLGAKGVRQGPNETGAAAWYGPEPPRGHGIHHYYFWVYALSRTVNGEPNRAAFITEYADAIIEQARTVGLYSR